MNLVAPSLTLWQAAQKPGNDHRHKVHFYHRHHQPCHHRHRHHQPCHHRHCQFHHLCDRHYLQCFFLITKDKVSPSDWSWLFAKKQMIITGYVLYKRLAHWPICNSAWFKPVEKIMPEHPLSFLRVAVFPIQFICIFTYFCHWIFLQKIWPKRLGDLGAMAVLLCFCACPHCPTQSPRCPSDLPIKCSK